MKVLLKLIILTSILLLFGCTNDIELNKITQDERIDILVHQEVVENGVVIFYVPKLDGSESAKASFEARFIQKTLFGWKPTFDRGGLSGTLERDLFSLYLPRDNLKSPFPVLFGEITNPKIEKVMIEFGAEPVVLQAKTVKEKGRYIWFVFLEEPKEKTIYTIKGYTNNGELIETVEEESYLPKN